MNKNYFDENKEEIGIINIKSLNNILNVGFFGVLIFFLLTFWMFEPSKNRTTLLYSYVILFVLVLLIGVVTRFLIKSNNKKYYINYSVLIIARTVIAAFTTYASLFHATNLRGLAFMTFNILIPSIFITKRKDVIISINAYAIIFCIISYVINKEALDIFKLDLFVALSSVLIGVPYNLIISKIRIRDEYYKKIYFNQANMDVLTKLPNRRNFKETFNNLVNNIVGENEYLALGIIDLDNFKTFNDKFGHDVGDKIISKVSKVFSDFASYEQIYVARFGGDEFVFLADNFEKDRLEKALTELLSKFQELEVEGLNTNIVLTASIGVSIIKKEKEIIEELLFKEADKLLYRIKNSEKNGCLIEEFK